MQTKTKRNGEIELLRLVFCILIILFHCNKHLFNVLDPYHYVYALSPRGYIGVEFFFMLSGYFMAHSIEKKKNAVSLGTDSFRFIWKKYFSIFWYHIIAYVAFVIVHSIIMQDFSFDKLFNLIPGALLLTRSGLLFTKLDDALWYLSAMLLVMAAMYPVAKRFFDVYAKAIAPISAVLIYGAIIHNYNTLSGTSAYGNLGFRCMWRAAAGLNLGMFMYCCVKALKKYNWTKKDDLIAKISRGIMLGAVCVYSMCLNPKKYEIFAVIVIFFALTLCFAFPYENVKWLDSKAVSYLGRLSLSLYLNQNLAIIIGRECFRKGFSDVMLVITIVAMDFALSALCMFFGDKISAKFNSSRINKLALGIA